MNTHFNASKINPKYKELFSFKNNEDQIDHKAQMISYRILSEVEKLCEEKGLKKKDLAALLGTSRSYITQLFNGTKKVNTEFMGKVEMVLNFQFEINLSMTKNQNRKSKALKKELAT